MGLCRVDLDRLDGLVSRLGETAAVVAETRAAAGLASNAGYASSGAAIAAAVDDVADLLSSWQDALRWRADLLRGLRPVPGPEILSSGILRQRTVARYLATHVADPEMRLQSGFRARDAAALGGLVSHVVASSAPVDVADFFASLADETAVRLAVHHPELIGPLDGAPHTLRFLANDLLLEGAWQTATDPAEESALADLLAGGADLLVFEPDHGRLVEWLGPHDAGHVAVWLPGAGADLASFPGLRRSLGAMITNDPSGGDLAVLASLAYPAPPTFLHGVSRRYASAGAPSLVGLVAGLDLAGRHLTVIGHSYGSTVIGAAFDAGLAGVLPTDTDILFLASPGVGHDSVTAIPHPADRVWAAVVPGDEVLLAIDPMGLPDVVRCNVGLAGPIQACDLDEWLVHGRNPTHPSFGARTFTAADAPGRLLEHSGYLSVVEVGDTTRPSPMLAAILAVVTAGDPPDAMPFLTESLE